MDDEVLAALAVCRREVESDGQLSFASRRALLRALGPLRLDEDGFGTELVVGKRRRLALALACSRRVALYWARDFGTPALEDLLVRIEAYASSGEGLAEVRRRTDSLQGGLLNDPGGKDQAYLAGRTVAGTGWVAVADELLSAEEGGVTEEELADPEDPDLWDPAYFAAGAWAGGMPWSPSFDATRYREFWRWYLDDAVPGACGVAD